MRINQLGGDPKKLTVIYRNFEVERNRLYKQDQVAQQPKVVYDSKIGKGLYTLIMVNPDFPDPADPIDREWLQWMVVNIFQLIRSTLVKQWFLIRVPNQI